MRLNFLISTCLADTHTTRANIYVEHESLKVLFYRHNDGYPQCTFQEIERMVDECKYEFPAIVEKMMSDSDTYRLVSMEAGDAEYRYYINCRKKRIDCYDVWEKQYIDGHSQGHTCR